METLVVARKPVQRMMRLCGAVWVCGFCETEVKRPNRYVVPEVPFRNDLGAELFNGVAQRGRSNELRNQTDGCALQHLGRIGCAPPQWSDSNRPPMSHKPNGP